MPPFSKKLLLALACLVVLNVGLCYLGLVANNQLGPTWEDVSPPGLHPLLLPVLVYGVLLQLLARLLGSPAALLPYRGWPYPDRVPLYSAAIALALHRLLLGLLVSNLASHHGPW